jgi:hypothetical protein
LSCWFTDGIGFPYSQASAEPGEYFLYDLDETIDGSLKGVREDLQILAKVVVVGAEDCSQ